MMLVRDEIWCFVELVFSWYIFVSVSSFFFLLFGLVILMMLVVCVFCRFGLGLMLKIGERV